MTTLLEDTLTYDEVSAVFWSEHLGAYGRKMRTRSDNFAIAAAVISTITGAAIWTTVSDSTEVWAQAIVTGMAVAAAVVALVPKLKGYSDCATNIPTVSAKYGRALLKLRLAHDKLSAGEPGARDEAIKAIQEFYDVRDEKEKLTPYPADLELAATKLYESIDLRRVERAEITAGRDPVAC